MKASHLLHVLIGLGHFCKVIIRPSGVYVMLPQEREGLQDCGLSLTVTVKENKTNDIISLNSHHFSLTQTHKPGHLFFLIRSKLQ